MPSEQRIDRSGVEVHVASQHVAGYIAGGVWPMLLERIVTSGSHRHGGGLQVAAEKGVKALGTRDAGGLHAFADLAGQAAAGELVIPIGAAYSLSDVKDAYTALAECLLHGRTILRSQVVA